MDMTEDGRIRLAKAMADQRRRLGLSVRAASTEAKINRDTWADAEAAKRDLRPHNRAGVERALHWAHGSIEIVLEGGEPTPATADPSPSASTKRAATDEERLAKAFEDIEELDVSEPTKDRMRASVVRSYKRASAAPAVDRVFEGPDKAGRQTA